LKKRDLNRPIVDFIKGNIINLSKHKFSSNVVEKCFEYDDGENRDRLFKEIDIRETVKVILFDQFGNYGKTLVLNFLVL
jgi:hypothetical protein